MYPGWRVYVDDRKVTILRVNGIFRGVLVPPGEHRVSFRYEPASLRAGWMTAIGAALVLMTGIAFAVVRGGARRVGGSAASRGANDVTRNC
jgi:uncharacterized membrane protein YfhO